jgi:trehalose 6-phosphate phosphatase
VRCRESAIFLDVDGTLLPLAAHPRDVLVPPTLLASLVRIRSLVRGALALVSGRPLADLDRLFSPEIFAASGQHGSERRDGAGRLHRLETHVALLHRLRPEIGRCVAEDPESFTEDKGLSLAVHVRGGPEVSDRLWTRLETLVSPHPELVLLKGKNVLEVRPAAMDKGRAVSAFLEEPPFRGRHPVFLGDDVTDESAFEVVNRRNGVSIKVGDGPTRARYRLGTPTAAVAWLARLSRDRP